MTISAFDLDRLKAQLAAVTEQRDRLAEQIENLKEELESHAWTISPAMAQAKIDELVEQRDRLAAALERVLEYQGRFAEEDPESIATEALQSLTNPNEL